MPDINKTQRWLDLIALLLGRKVPLAVDEIIERVPAYAEPWSTGNDTKQASVRRMFERDKDELRKMGIPIESVRYDINYGAEQLEGYRITRRDFYLPYLRAIGGEAGEGSGQRPEYPGLRSIDLEPDEARLALEGLRRVAELPDFPFAAEARSAFSKLTFDLDPERYPATPVLWVDRPGASEVVATLRGLSDALLAGKRVRFRYHGIQRDETTERDVAPYGVFFQREWYLVGHDALREAVRVFRVSRIEEPQPNRKAPGQRDFDVPTDFDLRAFLDRKPWRLDDAPPVMADVRFRFPSSIWAERNKEGERIRDDADGAATRRFAVTDPDPFLRWVLSFGGEAEILSPPEMVAAYRALAARVAEVHRG